MTPCPSVRATRARRCLDGLNTGTVAGGDLDRIPGPGVPGHPGLPLPDLEGTETPDFEGGGGGGVFSPRAMACFMALRNPSTTRAQSFFVMPGPIASATCSTKIRFGHLASEGTVRSRTNPTDRRPPGSGREGNGGKPNAGLPQTSRNRYQAGVAGNDSPHPLPPGLHQPDELVEQVATVVGSWSGLRVVLHREHGQTPVGQSPPRSPSYRLIWVSRRSGAPTREPPSPARTAKPWFCEVDLHCVVVQVLHGVVRTVVAEGELVRLPAEGPGDELMPQADPEDRDPLRGEDRGWPPPQRTPRRGPPGPLEMKSPSGFNSWISCRVAPGGDHRHLTPPLRHQLRRMGLHPEVEGHDMEPFFTHRGNHVRTSRWTHRRPSPAPP